MRDRKQQGPDSTETEILQRLADMAREGRPGVLATVIGTRGSTPRHEGSRMLVDPGGDCLGSIGGGSAEAAVLEAAADVLGSGRCRRLDLDLSGELGVCGGKMEVFLEPIGATAPVWVFGAGHVGRSVAELGRALPMRMILLDDREDVLAHVPRDFGAERIICTPQDLAARMTASEQGAVIMANRNADLDGAFLEAVLTIERRDGCEFAFVGGLASSAKKKVLRDRLSAAGVPAERLARLQLPVGVAVGAETPAEIAVSVLAEVLAVLRGVDMITDEDGRPCGLPFQRRRKR